MIDNYFVIWKSTADHLRNKQLFDVVLLLCKNKNLDLIYLQEDKTCIPKHLESIYDELVEYANNIDTLLKGYLTEAAEN